MTEGITLNGRRVLFISYNGMLGPLGHSQVLPYLRELSKRGVQFTLLSFETADAFGPAGSEICTALRGRLATEGIEWHWLRYHRTPSLPATIYDVMNGVRFAKRLVRRNGIELVHARSHIPVTIALALKKRFGLKIIFDLRGLMAEEYVDAGNWREGSLPYRLTKMLERRALAAADGIVTLTKKIWPIIRQWDGLRDRDVVHEVVPCCTDLELFKFSTEDLEGRRAELGLRDRFVLVYSGSVGGWYSIDEMADFFTELVKKNDNWHFLWLTRGPEELIRKLMSEREVNTDRYSIKSVAPADVASYLSSCDAGIGFYKPALSRLATSPIKVAEYLACGLPLIINAGVGDADSMVVEEKVGALVSDFTKDQYAQAATTIENLLRDRESIRRRTRGVAERLFDVRKVGVERYAHLYEAVLNGET